VFDDIFPHPLSAFRFAEFTTYLEAFRFSEVHSTGAALPFMHEIRTLSQLIRDFGREYPGFRRRVFQYEPIGPSPPSFFYCVFLNNAATIVEDAERTRGAFAFTLYPGGGFQLDAPESDAKLKRVLTSPAFRKVIVTQKVTRDYLLGKGWCSPEQIEFVYGVVIPLVYLSTEQLPRRIYGRDKDTIDIGFVAHKYMPAGRDKGFDLFIECANRLAGLGKHIRFHVVGPYSDADADVSRIRNQLRFYGALLTSELRGFYSTIDMIVSPNAPFILMPGAFDGFPTACCVEAALCGVAVFCADELHENRLFKDGEEIVIVSRDIDRLTSHVERYVRNYDLLRGVGTRAAGAFRNVFGWRQQMTPRVDLLARLCDDVPSARAAVDKV
jgi:glycosyltransferase involved in cell wall biosynthesis